MNALAGFFQDWRHALRQFRNHPGFFVVAVLVLGLGLGANAAIFSVVNAVLLRYLPYADPAHLAVLYEREIQPGFGRASISYPDYEDWRDQTHTLENLAIAREMQFNLSGNESATPERIDGAICSWTLLPALGVRPLLGRMFTPADDKPGAPRVAIIGYHLWKGRFGGAGDILSRHVRLDAEDYAIAGVMPPSFLYPRAGSDIWIPAAPAISERARTRRGWRQFHGVARLRPGVGIDQARIELEGIASRIRAANPGMPLAAGAQIFPMQEFATQNVRTALWVLFGAVACVLLIACVNIANLLLARASQRQREIAIRVAVGASRGRVVRQLLTESLLLALFGAAFGLLVSTFVIDALSAALPALMNRGPIQPTGEIRLDASVFLFLTLVAMAVGLAVGIAPALQLSRAELTSQLKDSSRSIAGGRGQSAFRSTLVSLEVALSLVLLVAAGLLLRSFNEIRSVRPGVRLENLLTAGISLPENRYQTDEAVSSFADELRRKLRALPGVRAADVASCLPIDRSCGDQFFNIDGHPLPPGQANDAQNWAVSPDFFATMGIPILRGRAFTEQDSQRVRTASKRYSAVINESMARKFWPGENPLGQTIYFGDAAGEPRWEVVGICGDVASSLDQKPVPAYFFPFRSVRTFFAVVRTAGHPGTLAAPVRQVIGSLDGDLPAFQIRTMEEVAEGSSSNRRFTAMLIGLFAATALLLAAIGLYGVLSYLVSQRLSEIGIRMVLGATTAEVQRLVMKQGLRPAAVGLIVGLAAAFASAKLLDSLLFGVSSSDPVTFVTASLVLLAVALLACFLPAWRAARVDPADALRDS